jgi:hypothetical protein
MANLSDILGAIRTNESGNNYTLSPQENYNYPISHASGAYQIQPGTWQNWTTASGIGTQYSQAYLAPSDVQDQVAGWAVQQYGPNATYTWAASAPPGGYPSLTGDTSLTPSFASTPLAPMGLGGNGLSFDAPATGVSGIDTPAASVGADSLSAFNAPLGSTDYSGSASASAGNVNDIPGGSGNLPGVLEGAGTGGTSGIGATTAPGAASGGPQNNSGVAGTDSATGAPIYLTDPNAVGSKAGTSVQGGLTSLGGSISTSVSNFITAATGWEQYAGNFFSDTLPRIGFALLALILIAFGLWFMGKEKAQA